LKVGIISHTEHYTSSEGTIVGWGPTVKELNKLLEIADSIVHIAPLHKESAPKSALSYTSNKIKFVPLKPSGGKGFSKLSILLIAPYNLVQIHKALKDVDYVQFRAPTGIGIYILPFLKFFSRKKYWVKYAGNWIDKNMPLGNKFQKFWLQKFTSINTKVTVNGFWKNERLNIIPFENPCLDHDDRNLGDEIVKKKKLSNKITYCFVGALNTHKGVDIILDVFSRLETDKIEAIHFVGDGEEKEKYIELSKKVKYKTFFHGFLSKDSIREIYFKSHFIILPSKSEGFPKVIAEAMNYGCIPIVSNISCIDQYVKNEENGFLLEFPTSTHLEKEIKKSLRLTPKQYFKWTQYNYVLTKKFTYSYYNSMLKTKIFKG